MGLSTVTTIFLFVICMIGGVVIGILFSRYLKSTPETPAELEDRLKKSVPGEEKGVAQSGDEAIVHLGRNDRREFWLEMDGQRVKAKNKLKPDQKQVLKELVADLRSWLDLPPSQDQESPVYEALPAQNSAFTRSFSPRATEIKEVPPAPMEEHLLVGAKSLVAQIDEILQKKLVGTAFSDLDIHLWEGPAGEVHVKIGAINHLGVESIPNPEIQALIREAVADWEDKIN